MSKYAQLNKIKSNKDVKKLSIDELNVLSAELREKMVQTVSKNGGHLSSNLGIVEVTIALHKEFDLPNDQIVFDVGHQCYPHKLLTGRLDDFYTLRQAGGISGFPSPCESDCDLNVAGHSSTAISFANGLAKAKAINKDDGYVVAVVGDGALTGGLAYEGLSNAGRSNDNLIVVLNDNGMSISENVGYVARHLASLRANSFYLRLKNTVSNIISSIPLIGPTLRKKIMELKVRIKKRIYKRSSFFEEMGFYYIGPLDGHDLSELSKGFQAAKNLKRPVLMHVATVKGKGYSFAEENPDIYHGVSGFDPKTGVVPSVTTSFSSVFANHLLELAKKDEKICVITAAMLTGTGLAEFNRTFHKRCFDVGIAEEHAVVFASGLAKGGAIPVFSVYSTFLQRSYDQIMIDTAIENEHVILAVDRAGIVGDDGVTHQGIFDVSFLNTIPNITIYSPSSYKELESTMDKAIYDTKGLVAVRYPRGGELGVFAGGESTFFEPYTYINTAGAKVLIVTYGRIFAFAARAKEKLNSQGILTSILKLNQIKPLLENYSNIAMKYDYVFFFEEGSLSGGAGEKLGAVLMQNNYSGKYVINAIEGFLSACKPLKALSEFNLDEKGMINTVLNGISEIKNDNTMIGFGG